MIDASASTISDEVEAVPKQQRAAGAYNAPAGAPMAPAPREMRERILSTLELLKSAPAPVASLTKYALRVLRVPPTDRSFS